MKLCQFTYRIPDHGIGFCNNEAVECEDYCAYHLEYLANDQDPWGEMNPWG